MKKQEFEDLKTAALLIKFAYSAKSPGDRATIGLTLGSQGWRCLEWFGDPGGRGVQLFTALHGDSLWVAIPGTNHPDDWVDYNLCVGNPSITGFSGVFRKGFHVAAMEAWKMLVARNLLDLIRFGRGRVIIAGHSLGGPIAGGISARLAASLSYNDRRKVNPITLTSPRFCDAEAAVELARVFPSGRRYRLSADVVPDLVAGWPGPWRHAFSPETLRSDGTTSAAYPRARELWRALWRPGFNLIADHSIESWVDWCSARTRRA
jgi:hypothetical protein